MPTITRRRLLNFIVRHLYLLWREDRRLLFLCFISISARMQAQLSLLIIFREMSVPNFRCFFELVFRRPNRLPIAP